LLRGDEDLTSRRSVKLFEPSREESAGTMPSHQGRGWMLQAKLSDRLARHSSPPGYALGPLIALLWWEGLGKRNVVPKF
jgi:hypothetical protein